MTEAIAGAEYNRYLARTGCTFNVAIGSATLLDNGVIEVQIDQLPYDGRLFLEPYIEDDRAMVDRSFAR